MNKRKKGSNYEKKAAEFLLEKGYEILEQNYFEKHEEIDIICKKGNEIVFVEVKYRQNCYYGNGFEAIGKSKQYHIYNAAIMYLYKHHLNCENFRFDCISFFNGKLEWLQNTMWGDEIGF